MQSLPEENPIYLRVGRAGHQENFLARLEAERADAVRKADPFRAALHTTPITSADELLQVADQLDALPDDRLRLKLRIHQVEGMARTLLGEAFRYGAFAAGKWRPLRALLDQNSHFGTAVQWFLKRDPSLIPEEQWNARMPDKFVTLGCPMMARLIRQEAEHIRSSPERLRSGVAPTITRWVTRQHMADMVGVSVQSITQEVQKDPTLAENQEERSRVDRERFLELYAGRRRQDRSKRKLRTKAANDFNPSGAALAEIEDAMTYICPECKVRQEHAGRCIHCRNAQVVPTDEWKQSRGTGARAIKKRK